FSICEADHQWSPGERELATELFDHLWCKRLTGEELSTAARHTAEESVKLEWYSVVRPFDRIAPLRDRVGTLETLVMRLANIIARSDGSLRPQETAMIKTIQDELRLHLRAIPIDQPNDHSEIRAAGQQALEKLNVEASVVHAVSRPSSSAGT